MSPWSLDELQEQNAWMPKHTGWVSGIMIDNCIAGGDSQQVFFSRPRVLPAVPGWGDPLVSRGSHPGLDLELLPGHLHYHLAVTCRSQVTTLDMGHFLNPQLSWRWQTKIPNHHFDRSLSALGWPWTMYLCIRHPTAVGVITQSGCSIRKADAGKHKHCILST